MIHARLPAEAGTLVLRALELAVGDIPLPHPSVQDDDSAETRRAFSCEGSGRAAWPADARALLAESFVAHGAAALGGGERMDHVLALDVLVQRAERAGTFPRKRALREEDSGCREARSGAPGGHEVADSVDRDFDCA